MILDLTNTDRYYPVNRDRTVAGMKHIKFNLPGHGQYVNERALAEIFEHVINFARESPGQYVGVHCTHGFNRTGLVICAFLAHHRRLDINAAIDDFARARQDGIYREEVIRNLLELYDPEYNHGRQFFQFDPPLWHIE